MPDDVFTAELMLQRARSPHAADALAPAAAESLAAARHRQVLTALAGLERRLESLSPGAAASAPEAPSEASDPADPANPEADQVDRLRVEVGELSRSIVETKREIAALRNRDPGPDRLIRANDELDAVVRATESATETILATAEEIDALAGRLRSSAVSASDVAALEEISERTIRVFEACNFQDITGQRIAKVVNTMRFVEGRVERMIEILGGVESVADLDPAEDASAAAACHADERLLHGPQLATDQTISQDDIDKLFD